MSAISQILLSTSKIIIENSNLDTNHIEQLEQLKTDEVLQAKVLSVFSERRATLLINDKKIPIKTGVPLKEGEDISLKIEKSGDEFILKLVDKGTQATEIGQRFLKNLDRSGPYKHIENLVNTKNPEKMETLLSEPDMGKKNLALNKFISTEISRIVSKSPPLKAEYQFIANNISQNKALTTEVKLVALIRSAPPELFKAPEASSLKLEPFFEKVVSAVLEEKNIPAVPEKEIKPPTFNPETSPTVYRKPEYGAETKIPVNIEKKEPTFQFFRNIETVYERATEKMAGTDLKLLERFASESQIKFEHKLLMVFSNDEKLFKHPILSGVDMEEPLLYLLADEGQDVTDLKTLFKNHLETLFDKQVLSDRHVLSDKQERPDFKPEVWLNRLKSVDKLVKSVSLKSDTPDINILKNVINASGLKWENTVYNVFSKIEMLKKNDAEKVIIKDLKGLALSMLTNTDEGMEKTGHVLRNFVDTLEQLQLINKYSFEENGRYMLPLPVMTDDILKFGQLLIDLGSNEKEEKELKDRLIRVSFILEMTQLGDLRADFSILKKAINGTFGVGTKELCSFIESGIPDLVSKLGQNGYHVHHIGCQVIDPEILSNTSLTDQLLKSEGEAEGVLSLII